MNSPNSNQLSLSDRIRDLESQLRDATLSSKRLGLVWTPQEETSATQLMTDRPRIQLTDFLKSSEGPGLGSPHLFLRGENLHALIALRASHRRAVDLIYIDPPYNTGNKDFRYNDRFIAPDDQWRHSSWLSFMERRLRIALDLLKDDGVLAISIDDNEYARLILLLEQLFGDGSVKTVVVKMSELAGPKMGHNALPKLKEYLLLAGKPGAVNGLRFPKQQKEAWDVNYKTALKGFSPRSLARLRQLGHGPVSEEHVLTEAEVAEVDQMFAGVTTESEKDAAIRDGINVKDKAAMDVWRVTNAWRLIQTTNGGGSVQSLMGSRIKRGELSGQAIGAIRTPRGILYLAQTKDLRTILFADDYLTTRVGDIWTDISTTSLAGEGGVEFKNGKKPQKLLRRIIGAVPRTDAVVLDFFGGSGSTLEAVLRLNAEDGGTRRCILVTGEEDNIPTTTTIPRIQGLMTGNVPSSGSTVLPVPGQVLLGTVSCVPQNQIDETTDHPFSLEEVLLRACTAYGAVPETSVGQNAQLLREFPSGLPVIIWPETREPNEEELKELGRLTASGQTVGKVLIQFGPWGDMPIWAENMFSGWSLCDMNIL